MIFVFLMEHGKLNAEYMSYCFEQTSVMVNTLSFP